MIYDNYNATREKEKSARTWPSMEEKIGAVFNPTEFSEPDTDADLLIFQPLHA
jgi:hypothetical protein